MDSNRFAGLTAEYEHLFLTVGYIATDAEHTRLKAAVENARGDLDVAQQQLETAQAESKGSGRGAVKSAP